jgi:hypothetical protein
LLAVSGGLACTKLGASYTENECCTCAAALYVASPAWFAFNVHVPGAWKLTTPLEMEHTPAEDESTVIVAGRAPGFATAVGVYVGPPTLASLGALDVNTTACEL